VLAGIGQEVDRIYVIDDACPEGSGQRVEQSCADRRVQVLKHEHNQGVGGATMTGYQRAIADGAEVIVKLDADGQMDPRLIPKLVRPILAGVCDYCKGNRFFRLQDVRQMPTLRLVGNACLSFLTKAASGYWDIFDPTNGYTAIHAAVAARLPMDKISTRFFFESDVLFRLNTLRAVVVDIPLEARYGEERSSLRPLRVTPEFAWKNLRNLFKRIFYNYFLRDFNVASIELLSGFALVAAGGIFGLRHWLIGFTTGQATPTGTVMLAVLPVLLGAQLLLGFLAFDVQSVPRQPIHRHL
jgi:glycosyltransferase involved in cell wall biosynthesis